MPRGYRAFILAIVGILLGAGVLWTWLAPEYPVIPTSEYQKAEDTQYSPGTPRCMPSRLNRLPDAEGADERYRCEQAAEEHRLKGDELVQQTRATEAALATVHLTYAQSVMMLAGTIFGLLTFISAFAAVLYAKRAADAARDALDHSKSVSVQELRPWIEVSVDPAFATTQTSSLIISLMITMKNIGRTPAQNVRYEAEPIEGGEYGGDHEFFHVPHQGTRGPRPVRGILPGGEITDQELVFVPWGDHGPIEGLTPLVGVNVTYDLPDGRGAQTSISFYIGLILEGEDNLGAIRAIEGSLGPGQGELRATPAWFEKIT